MHEFGFTGRIVSLVLTVIRDHKVMTVARVDVELGDLTFLDHDQVRLAYRVLTRGTDLECSELMIAGVPGVVVCSKCEVRRAVRRGLVDEDIVRCKCGGKLRIVQGQECRVVGIVAGQERVVGDHKESLR